MSNTILPPQSQILQSRKPRLYLTNVLINTPHGVHNKIREWQPYFICVQYLQRLLISVPVVLPLTDLSSVGVEQPPTRHSLLIIITDNKQKQVGTGWRRDGFASFVRTRRQRRRESWPLTAAAAVGSVRAYLPAYVVSQSIHTNKLYWPPHNSYTHTSLRKRVYRILIGTT